MKLVKIIIVLCLSISGLKYYAQNNCGSSLPFCATTNYTFAAGVNNGSAAAGPNYGCLLTQPNPAWYYVQVAQTGPIVLHITGTSGGDVDAAAWGPFAGPTGNCNSLGATISCDYGVSSTATISIPNAQAGQYYQVLITNYSNQGQNINFVQNNATNPGAGSTNCNFTSGVTSQSICPTRTATLVANTSLINPAFVWTPGGQTTQTITVSPATTTVYSVSITGLPVAGGTATTVVNTGTVTILPTPTVVLSSNSSVCQGSNIILSATSGFTNYVWAGPVATQTTVASTTSIPNASSADVGTYTVTVNSAQGCPGTGTTNVSLINTDPVIAPVPPSACEGGTVSLSASALGAVSYSWSGPGGYTSNLQNPVLNSVTMSQAGVYTVTASFVGTVGTNTCTTTATTTVTIIPASTVALTPVSPVCNKGVISLSAPGGGNTYAWTGPNSFSSTLQNPVINNAEVLNQGVYSVSITASGCVRTGSIMVNVYNGLSFTSVPTDVTLCFGHSASLSSAGSGGSGGYSYSWNPANDLTDPNAGTTTATANTTTDYTLTLSDANCPVTQTVTTIVTVSVNPTPIITLGKDLRGCEPFLAPIESSSYPPSANCSWLFSNSTAYGQCGTTTGFLFPVHGTYDATLSVIDVNGCTNTITATNYVTVDPNPIADFTYIPLNPTVLVNEVTFSDQSTIGAPMQGWEWNFGDYFSLTNNTDSVPNPVHVYDNAATYTVSLIVTNTFGCKDTTSRYVIVEEEFALFIPNAFTPNKSEGKNDIFFPQGIGFDPASFQMVIYDRWGTEIYKTNDITRGWDGSIKGGKPAQGVYVYKIIVTDFKKHDREFVGHVTIL